jgi:flagellin-like protein
VARRVRRGLSEVVTLMVVILVAVVAALAIKAWVDAQSSKLPTTEMATADWSATFSTNRWLLTVNVRSNLDRALLVTGIRVAMADGTVLTFTAGTATYVSGATTYTATATPAPTQTLPFKSSQSFVLVIPGTSANPPKLVEVSVQDSATGATAWIRAVGGVQV